MNYSYNELKKKTVINVYDGKKIGKICDVTVSYPECCLVSLTAVPFCSPFPGDRVTFSPCIIDKIGEDAILIRLGKKSEQKIEDIIDE